MGFTWQDDEEVEQQVEAEWLEWLDASANGDQEAQKHELGDLLFSITELGRRKGIKASEALDLATLRFLRRFAAMEAMAAAKGQDFTALSLDDKDELWNAAKAQEAVAAPQADAASADRTPPQPLREVGAVAPESETDQN